MNSIDSFILNSKQTVLILICKIVTICVLCMCVYPLLLFSSSLVLFSFFSVINFYSVRLFIRFEILCVFISLSFSLYFCFVFYFRNFLEKLLTSEGRELRRALFSLKQIFQDDKDLVHGFVALGGLNSLVRVGNNADQNYQNYILRALGQVSVYKCGVNNCKTLPVFY